MGTNIGIAILILSVSIITVLAIDNKEDYVADVENYLKDLDNNSTGSETVDGLSKEEKMDQAEKFLNSLSRSGGSSSHSDHDHSHHQHHSPNKKSAEQSGHDHSGHGGHEGHMMKMWFHGGYDEVILFDFWRTDSLIGMLLSCVAIFVMGATYEGVKWFRVYLQIQQANSAAAAAFLRAERSGVSMALLQCQQANVEGGATNTTNATRNASSQPFIRVGAGKTNVAAFSIPRLMQGALYVVQLVLAYWLMLIVMTYNTYLTAAVVLGAGFGHWLFAVLQLRSADGETADSFATDACH